MTRPAGHEGRENGRYPGRLDRIRPAGDEGGAKKARDEGARHIFGGTLLHMAAKRNRAGLCHWLLRLGAGVNRADIRDMTPLHHAAFHGATDAARLLIAHTPLGEGKSSRDNGLGTG